MAAMIRSRAAKSVRVELGSCGSMTATVKPLRYGERQAFLSAIRAACNEAEREFDAVAEAVLGQGDEGYAAALEAACAVGEEGADGRASVLQGKMRLSRRVGCDLAGSICAKLMPTYRALCRVGLAGHDELHDEAGAKVAFVVERDGRAGDGRDGEGRDVVSEATLDAYEMLEADGLPLMAWLAQAVLRENQIDDTTKKASRPPC